MLRDPIVFGAMSASRTMRHSLAVRTSTHQSMTPASDLAAADVLDEAFAEYSRIDAGSAPSADATSDSPISNNWRLVTRHLIADIETQLETLDRQRRQLARLLEGADIAAID
jgi:hypothetical protein